MGDGYSLLLGGARSGKSALAERLASGWSGNVTVLATAEGFDEDLRARIARHRADRPLHWSTVEEPIAISAAAAEADGFLVVDCITVWLGNAMHRGLSEERIHQEIVDLVGVLTTRQNPSIVVSNEVGLGVHPETELGRSYRDLLGRVNVRLAASARDSYLLVAARLLRLESIETLLGGR